jgi:hypothetical protein
MRDEDDYDDEDDLEDDRRASGRPSFPGIVRAAGIIWIGVGAIGLINTIATLALAGANQGPGGPSNVCCGAGIAIAFLLVGFQTVKGTAKDTLGNAIGSIALGLLQLGLAAVIGLGGAILGANAGANPGANANGLPAAVLVVTAVIVGLMGATLILAGILALMGRARYREWRQAHFPSSRSRRRRRDYDDDDDEEPRRRRRDEDDD